MPLIVPKVRITECRELGICAELKSDDKALLKWIEDQPVMMSRHKLADKQGYLALILGGKDNRHAHVELTAESNFRRAPEPKFKTAEIIKAFDRLLGQEVDATLWGIYFIKKQKTPAIISSTFVQASDNGVTLKLSGATISVQGAPISKIEWRLTDDNDTVRIRLSVSKELKITESYIVDAQQLIESAFEAIVVKGGSNGGPHQQITKQA